MDKSENGLMRRVKVAPVDNKHVEDYSVFQKKKSNKRRLIRYLNKYEKDVKITVRFSQ